MNIFLGKQWFPQIRMYIIDGLIKFAYMFLVSGNGNNDSDKVVNVKYASIHLLPLAFISQVSNHLLIV